MSKIVGLTGPTGSGKSSVSEIAKKLGIRVIDCDLKAREAVLKGSKGLKALTEVFSNDILNTDGTLNRKALAAKAFKTRQNTELLNKTLFPFITEIIKREIGNGDVLLDAPTLFESGMDAVCDTVIAVLCDKDKRIKRIIERDNITSDEALIRINAGKDDAFYKQRAEYVIHNDNGLNEYLTNIEKILKEIYGGKENV